MYFAFLKIYTNLPLRIGDKYFSWILPACKRFNAVGHALRIQELDPPYFLKDALVEDIEKAPQQYIDSRGYGSLREAIDKENSPIYNNLKWNLNPETEIIATAGAVAGLYCTLLSIISKGDEIVTFEPCWTEVLNKINLFGMFLR